MKEKDISTLAKRRGTKKQLKKQAQKKRVTDFLNQNLGTITHKSEKDYDRGREKEKLRKDIEEQA